MRVSIIIPIYQVESYIVDCAISVLSQTYPDIEYIFVDDGSPDQSVSILEDCINSQFPTLWKKIRIIRKPHEGLPQARRTGLQEATGTWILHVDSDDWIERDTVEKLVRMVEENDSDVIYFQVRKELGKGRSRIVKDPEFVNPLAYAKAIMDRKAHGYIVNKFIHRSLYSDDLYYPRLGMHEDIILSIQILSHARKALLLPEPLYHYRRDNALSLTHGKRSERHLLSSTNFMDLYQFYHGFQNGTRLAWIKAPLLNRCILDACRYAPHLFAEYPFLEPDYKSLPLSFRIKHPKTGFALWKRDLYYKKSPANKCC